MLSTEAQVLTESQRLRSCLLYRCCMRLWLRISLSLDKVAPPQCTLWRAILSIPNLRLVYATVCIYVVCALGINQVLELRLSYMVYVWGVVPSFTRSRLQPFTVFSMEGNLVNNQVAPLLHLYTYKRTLRVFFSLFSRTYTRIYTQTSASLLFKLLPSSWTFDRTKPSRNLVHFSLRDLFLNPLYESFLVI